MNRERDPRIYVRRSIEAEKPPPDALPFEGFCQWHGKRDDEHTPQEDADDDKRTA